MIVVWLSSLLDLVRSGLETLTLFRCFHPDIKLGQHSTARTSVLVAKNLVLGRTNCGRPPCQLVDRHCEVSDSFTCPCVSPPAKNGSCLEKYSAHGAPSCCVWH